MGVSCREAHVQQQEVCTRSLPVRPLVPPLPAGSVQSPIPRRERMYPGRAEPRRQPAPASWSPRALALASRSLVASDLKEEVEKGKVKKCLSRHPCKQCREGQPKPELPFNIIYHPHPSEAWSPAVPVLQDVVSSRRRMCYLGAPQQLRAPAHVCAVPSDTPACSASLTLTMDTAQPSRSPARPRARSPAHPQCSPLAGEGALHAALDHPPLHTRLPL